LKEHSLGLTPSQWQQFLDSLTPEQRQLLEQRKVGKSLDAIAKDLKLRTNQVMGEWSKICLAAQAFRSAS
jgi:DNA-binding NarL/FixJ family response regulator